MPLSDAFVDTSLLKEHVKQGCGAIATGHRSLLTDGLKTMVADSLDLDAATREEYPQGNRWDYLLSVRQSGKLVGVEPHSAKDDQVSNIIAKKRASAQHLQAHLKTGKRISVWIWVASGKVRFSRMDPAIRRLDQNGIKFVGSAIRSFE